MDEELENFISETLGTEAYLKTNIVTQNVENYNVIAFFPLTEEAVTLPLEEPDAPASGLVPEPLEGPDAPLSLSSFPDSVTAAISPQGPDAPASGLGLEPLEGPDAPASSS